MDLNWSNWRTFRSGFLRCAFLFLWNHIPAAPTINKNETSETTAPTIIEVRRLESWARASCWSKVVWLKVVVTRPVHVTSVEPENMGQPICLIVSLITCSPAVEKYCVPVAHRPKLEHWNEWCETKYFQNRLTYQQRQLQLEVTKFEIVHSVKVLTKEIGIRISAINVNHGIISWRNSNIRYDRWVPCIQHSCVRRAATINIYPPWLTRFKCPTQCDVGGYTEILGRRRNNTVSEVRIFYEHQLSGIFL